MPYVNDVLRTKVNDEINQLTESLLNIENEDIEGVFNYTVSRLLKAFKRGPDGWNYKWASRATDSLHRISVEFDRRILAKYEDKCIIKNGDIDIYKEFDDANNSTK